MRQFVITIMDNEKSVEAADRCIKSAAKFGELVEKFPAYTPKDDPFNILKNERKVPTQALNEKYSRNENCAAAFLSHFTLWQKCLELNEPIMIFEHDAVQTAPIPESIRNGWGFKQFMSMGKPSYGRFRVPQVLGAGPLYSKRYFPGAHAYAIKPAGARQAVQSAQLQGAAPTDVFLNLDRFPFLEELYPWTHEAQDYFTTIQNELGCQAKHNYKQGYEIEQV